MRLGKCMIEPLLKYLKNLHNISEMPVQMGGRPRSPKESARLWKLVLASRKKAAQVEEEIKRRVQR